jgi:GNAT superfamily N-acetyltransferase
VRGYGLIKGVKGEVKMIRKCADSDFITIFEIVNDAAQAYQGIIPKDRWHEPYMPSEELRGEIEDGIVFWGMEQDGHLHGVMGIQDKGDVTLIRHAYVRTKSQRQGIGSKLLRHLEQITEGPVLIGTWTTASWAISFYQRHGYILVSEADKNHLLKKYWSIPERQVETSIVLANSAWQECLGDRSGA